MTPHKGLRGVVKYIARGEVDAAQDRLRGLLEDVDLQRDPSGLMVHVFGAALARRLSRESWEHANLYLSEFDISQIRLFDILVRQFPMVFLSSRISNRLLADHAPDGPRITAIDFGIGLGQQMAALLEQLARRPGVREITVVGVEPDATSLEAAGQTIAAAADRLGLAATYHPIHSTVEGLSRGDWEEIKAHGRSPLVNSAFTLHHVADVSGADARDVMVRRLRWLEPAALVVAEPNSDHRVADLASRFDNAWLHFGTVFDALDTLHDVDQRDRDAIKVGFFGREIADILGDRDDVVNERHENAQIWRRRLSHARFEPVDVSPYVTRDATVTARDHDGYIGLDFGDVTVVSIFGARPTGGAVEFDDSVVVEGPQPLSRRALLDAPTYLAALIALAEADGVIHPREREFVARQAHLLGIDPEPLWDHQPFTVLAAGDLSERTRHAIVRDTVYLAMVDGHYADTERARVAIVAAELGVTAGQLGEVEAHVAAALREDESAPSWFKQYWFTP